MEAVKPNPEGREARDHLVPVRAHVFVCHAGKTCPTKGSRELVEHLRDLLAARGMQDAVRVTKSGCLVLCDIGPNLVVYPQGVWYSGVRQGDLQEIMESHLLGGHPVQRLLTPRKGGA